MKRLLSIAIAALITGPTLSVVAQTRSTSTESQGRIVTAEAARGTPEQNRSADDNEFLVEAQRTSVAVAKLGELAAERGRDQRVRDDMEPPPHEGFPVEF